MQHHNDTKKTQEDFFKQIYTSHFIYNVCVWEGVGDRTELQYIDPHSYGRQRWVFRSPGLLNRRPRGTLCWVMAFFTASYQQLLWIPTHRGPRGPLRPGVAFPTTSYQQLFSNCPQLIRAPRDPSTGLLYHILSSNSSTLQLLTFCLDRVI